MKGQGQNRTAGDHASAEEGKRRFLSLPPAPDGAPPLPTKPALSTYQRLLTRTVKVFKGSKKKAMVWLSAPNAAIGGDAPIERMTNGDYEAVEKLVDALAASAKGGSRGPL